MLKSEVEGKLRKAITGYDLINELFPDIDRFYEDYMVYHAQLKKGDSLEIKLRTIDSESMGVKYPVIDLFLVSKEGKKDVMTFSDRGGFYYRSKLLYPEE